MKHRPTLRFSGTYFDPYSSGGSSSFRYPFIDLHVGSLLYLFILFLFFFQFSIYKNLKEPFIFNHKEHQNWYKFISFMGNSSSFH
ncbi:hypothetical protein L6452_10153 [Arctium lappa]|uniref:Uncharacterized protein n=1 Tax=Arctium lappa TaxID=4217 RepID=A0ACB9DMI4_ARCLA|nr:hypothetical protein L6452_10153 [Arctium lappa]